MPKTYGLLIAKRLCWREGVLYSLPLKQIHPFLLSFLIHAVVFVIHLGASRFPVVSFSFLSFFVLQ